MTVIDLGAVRATRAAELQIEIQNSDRAIVAVTSVAEHFAVTAFVVSGPIRLVDEQFAVDVNRARWRRALAEVRKATRKNTPEVRASLVRIASDAFSAKLEELIRADDIRRGLPRRFLVVGGLWVTAHLRQWVPPSWPTVSNLGRLGTLAWMTHIEHTPYRMRPSTRAVFDAARKSLQANPVQVAIMSTEQEHVVDRIIRTCWTRGWRPEEAQSA